MKYNLCEDNIMCCDDNCQACAQRIYEKYMEERLMISEFSAVYEEYVDWLKTHLEVATNEKA